MKLILKWNLFTITQNLVFVENSSKHLEWAIVEGLEDFEKQLPTLLNEYGVDTIVILENKNYVESLLATILKNIGREDIKVTFSLYD